MELIRIPRRFRCPDPAEKIGRVTNKHERSVSFQLFLRYSGLEIKDGNVVRNRRLVCSLMQIFSVQFPDSNKEELDQICGEILVDIVRIFDRPMDKSSRHDFDSKGYARLNGPMYPLNAESCDLIILPRLYRKNQPGDFFHPERGITYNEWGTTYKEWGVPVSVDEIPSLDIPGLYGKYLFEQRSEEYNILLSTDIMTTCGRLKVNYATFNDAAEAFLTVRLVEWRGECHGANVYGRIRTYSTLLCDDGAKSVVFDLKRDESQRVRPLQYICMRRPVTVVPMGQFLKVEVEIELENMSSGDNDRGVVMVSKTCSFKARTTKDEVDVYIPEDCGDRFANYEDQSAAGEDENSDEEDQFMEDEPSDEETSSSDDKDQSEDSDDLFVHGFGEEGEEDESDYQIAADPQIISGEWGKIEVGVYWLPCWCRGCYQNEDLRSIYLEA